MNVDNSRPAKTGRLPGIVIGMLSGAIVGCVISLLTIRQLSGGIFLGLVGAFFGGVVGGKAIRTTGWLMLAGAIVGGLLAIALTQIGKAMLYGAPLGMVLGLVVGLALEETSRR
jgi:hypothetical protein